MFALDDIDRRLLGELLKDSKRSYRELAKAIGVSAATVINHVQRMESGGVIKDYSVRLDHERLGYELTVRARARRPCTPTYWIEIFPFLARAV